MILAGAARCVVPLFAAERPVRGSTFAAGPEAAGDTLRQTDNAVEGHLRRYETLPTLLARQAEVRDFPTAPPEPVGTDKMNRWLSDTNGVIDLSDGYLIGPDGRTLAASNLDRIDSFIGQNFAYRPGFMGAAKGGQGRFFAVGTTSGVRDYDFAMPVHNPAGQIVGVVALKIAVDDLEVSWRSQAHQTVVTHPEGFVFIETDPGRPFRGMLPLTPDRMAQTEVPQRYGDRPLEPRGRREAENAGRHPVTLAGSVGVLLAYLSISREMPGAGWTVRVLRDAAPLRAQVRLAVAAFALLLGIAISLGWALRQRRARLGERIALQARAQAELERQVAERTAVLRHANDTLHRNQADLIQAGKLAKLGRISAAPSHEIKQPLAAARNCADSAAVPIDRGELSRARDNMGQILSLIDRMAAIARQLRNVARKPDEPLRTLSLAQAVADAVQVAELRLKAARAAVRVDLPGDLPTVGVLRRGCSRLSSTC